MASIKTINTENPNVKNMSRTFVTKPPVSKSSGPQMVIIIARELLRLSKIDSSFKLWITTPRDKRSYKTLTCVSDNTKRLILSILKHNPRNSAENFLKRYILEGPDMLCGGFSNPERNTEIKGVYNILSYI
jgi:hypothetical protein